MGRERLCTSLHVVARQRGWSGADCDAVVEAAARTYRRRIADYASWHTLDLFYERTEIKEVVEHFPVRHRSGMKRTVNRARRKDHLRAVTKLTEVVDGQRRFSDDPPLLVHLDRTELWDFKGQGDPMVMEPENLSHYGALCAWILARSHARTGDAVKISGYLGKAKAFDRAIAAFARRYATMNEGDHGLLAGAVAGGWHSAG